MATELRQIFDTVWLESLLSELQTHIASFDEVDFRQKIWNDDCKSDDWESMALKQRIRHVATCLVRVLPQDFTALVVILERVAQPFSGLVHLVFTDVIELTGTQHPKLAVATLAKLTQGCSAEFAIRPFIEQNQSDTLATMLQWTADENEHIRRLASEGCRPKLPWATVLHSLKQNPDPLKPILEALKADKSPYVRKSVANNLNDISKDHPLWVLKLCQKWVGQNADTDWIIKHGCRTLLKQGNVQALALIGYLPPEGIELESWQVDESVTLGQKLGFSATLNFAQFLEQKVRLEYAISFLRKQQKPYRKVFKIGEIKSTTHFKSFSKTHDFKAISTRNYYCGEHWIELIVNGQVLAKKAFIVHG